jgi:hypothetical protein
MPQKTEGVRSGIKKRVGLETMIHELKCDPDEFIEILQDKKKATIRYEDRGFEDDDYIWLRQTQFDHKAMAVGKPLIYTGRQFFLKITYVHSHIGLMDNHVCISFKVLDRD